MLKTAQKQIARLQMIEALINGKKTGSADVLAKSLRCSSRHIFKSIKELKSLGAKIKWSAEDRSYVYSTGYRVLITFKIERKKRNAGRK